MLNLAIAQRHPVSQCTIDATKPRGATTAPWGFPEWFIIAQTAIPALLYLPGTNDYRVPIRIAPFAISLLGLLALPNKFSQLTTVHPARPWLLCALAYVALMVFHPTTNTYVAGL